jgi:serpin B
VTVRSKAVGLVLACALLAAACAAADPPHGPAVVAGAATARDTTPDTDDADVDAVVAGTTALALDLYRVMAAEPGNRSLSPYSIATGLAMVYAGAAGATAAEMRDVLHFTLPADRLHPALNHLDLALAAAADHEGVELAVANRTWRRTGLGVERAFVDLLGREYGAPPGELDVDDPEAARRAVNGWVADNTAGRVPELFPEGTITHETALVLANAVRFDAAWWFPFNPDLTRPQPFHPPDGRPVNVDMMFFNEYLPSGFGDGWQAVEMPYAGRDLSMVVIVPDHLADFEAALDADLLADVIGSIRDGGIHLALPRFEVSDHTDLEPVLRSLGMAAAFESAAADFSGMTGDRSLWLDAVHHESFVKVDEEGTEAAAATGSAMAGSHGPTVVVDRPFLYLIRDRVTGALAFLGRVVDPTA